MIRIGYASDIDNALVLFKQIQNGQFAAGIVLAGFGTQPMPGEICDDAIQQVVQYTASNLQKVMDALLEKNCTQMNIAKEVITRHIKRIHKGIRHFNANVGQGIYVAGCICYIAGEHFICLPFGGGSAYICDGTHIRPLMNLALTADVDPKYIWDAVGGLVEWNAVFDEGVLPTGSQLICSTQPPAAELLEAATDILMQTNQTAAAETIYSGLEQKCMPLAVLVLAQMAGRTIEREEDDKQAAS